MMLSFTILSVAFELLIHSTIVSATCAHGTYLQPRKTKPHHRQTEISKNETVKTVEVGKFGYLGMTGPTQWASLAAENAACFTSTLQSPIDITNSTAGSSTVASGTIRMS